MLPQRYILLPCTSTNLYCSCIIYLFNYLDSDTCNEQPVRYSICHISHPLQLLLWRITSSPSPTVLHDMYDMPSRRRSQEHGGLCQQYSGVVPTGMPQINCKLGWLGRVAHSTMLSSGLVGSTRSELFSRLLSIPHISWSIGLEDDNTAPRSMLSPAAPRHERV